VGSRLDLPEENPIKHRVNENIPVMSEEFMYVLRWSDIRTWGTDSFPVEGDLVYVP
jgi:hypothetical protein